MGKWEYTTSVVTHGFLGREADELNREEFEGSMNSLGEDGWELATVFLQANLQHEKDGHVLVFKRWMD